MKILCSISGIEFTCEHFPAYLTAREVSHPIFLLPQKKLLPYLSKWSAQELTPVDSYLLFLSLLNSTDLIDFRVPVAWSPDIEAVIAQNMEPLAKVISRISSVLNTQAVFPRYVISPETKTLTGVKHWIENWNEAYQNFVDGYSKEYDNRKLILREAALERLIKNPHLPISQYANKIADWAAIAGSFPEYSVHSPFSNFTVSMSDYWKEIIVRASKEESLFSIPSVDLEDLIEHCESNVYVGTIYSNALFKVLRKALARQKSFLGLGDMDIVKGKFQLLSSDDTIETANIKAMMDSAPESEPFESQYPNKIAYLKAKLRWQVSKKYEQSAPTQVNLNLKGNLL